MDKLGKLKKIEDLRTIWKNEAKDFTPWLAEEENMALLSEALGIDINVDEMESPAATGLSKVRMLSTFLNPDYCWLMVGAERYCRGTGSCRRQGSVNM